MEGRAWREEEAEFSALLAVPEASYSSASNNGGHRQRPKEAEPHSTATAQQGMAWLGNEANITCDNVMSIWVSLPISTL